MKKSAAVLAGAILALGGAAPAFADTGAGATTADSPGVVSGDVIQAPLHMPLNFCGATVDVAALMNPALGSHCANG
jgi:hypothetical protein